MTTSVTLREQSRRQFQDLFPLVLKVEGTVDFDSIAPNNVGTETITLNGVAPGDYCIASLDVDTGGYLVWAHVSAANTIQLHLWNSGGSPLDLGSTTFHITVFHTIND